MKENFIEAQIVLILLIMGTTVVSSYFKGWWLIAPLVVSAAWFCYTVWASIKLSKKLNPKEDSFFALSVIVSQLFAPICTAVLAVATIKEHEMFLKVIGWVFLVLATGAEILLVGTFIWYSYVAPFVKKRHPPGYWR